MTDYIGVPIEVDPDTLASQVFDLIQAAVPGWVPSDGNMDVRLISAFAQIAAETRILAADVPDTIFAQFGSSFMQLPLIQGQPAMIASTWTMRDTAGYTIPGDTLVQSTDSSGNVAFWTVYTDYIVPPGSAILTPVMLVANEVGAGLNNLSYLPGQMVLIDDLEFVSSIVSVGSAAGGADEEDPTAYLSRLRNDLQLLKIGPVLPPEFSTLAMTIPGVARATTIDGYDPVALTFNNARQVTVYVVDSAGADPGAIVRGNVDTYLQSLREVTFLVSVRAPHYTSVTTAVALKAKAGVDTVALKTAVDAAIADFLSPAHWGEPQVGESPVWTNVQFVRYFVLAAVIEDVIGVDHITSLTINGSATDFDLTAAGANGPVCMPTWNVAASTDVVTT